MHHTCDEHNFQRQSPLTGVSRIRNEVHNKPTAGTHTPPARAAQPSTTASEVVHFSSGAFATLIPELQRALADKKYSTPTPIQEKAIGPLIAGRDLLGAAQTGTGKTAAFVLPILQTLSTHKKTSTSGKPRVLILAPTRELAAQIGDSVAHYGRHLHISRTVIFGGVKQHQQVMSLEQGKDIVIATPGRLLDLMNQRYISLERIDIFVLDEADRMLDMGFLPDIKKIIAHLPQKRQTMFFSATFAPEISVLARELLKSPVEISISPEAPAVDVIEQSVYFVDKPNKLHLLIQLLSGRHMNKVLVFTKMKHTASRLTEKLNESQIRAEAIHGDKAQNARIRSLDSFKKGQVRVLVATDIAARGIDVKLISHVINYDLPTEPETYVHRIGRTARAGKEGDAISFCMAEERSLLHDIQKMIKKEIPVITTHPYHSEKARTATGSDAKPKPRLSSPQAAARRSRERLSNFIPYGDDRRGGPKSKGSRYR